MQPSALILVGVISTASGICGSLFWPFLQRRYGWTNHRILVTLVILCSMVPAYGCLGFLSVLRRAKFGGLTTQGEMFGLAMYFGQSSPSFAIISYGLSVIKARYMARFRAMRGLCMPSYFLQAKKLDGSYNILPNPTFHLNIVHRRYGLYSITDKVRSGPPLWLKSFLISVYSPVPSSALL